MPLGEDAREWKDGGGEAGGHCWPGCDALGDSSSSWAATFTIESVCPSCKGVAQSHYGPDELGRRTLS